MRDVPRLHRSGLWQGGFLGDDRGRLRAVAARRNVFWRAEGAVRVWPSALFLAPQNPQAASAVLHCDAPEPFALGSVSASSPALHCLAPTGVKARHHTVTACWRGARGGAPLEEHRITVRLEGLRQPVLQIPVYVLW